MDQGRFRCTNEEHTVEQGKYGETVKSPKDNSWVCPKCETINTGDVCILCGYQHKSVWKWIVLGIAGFLLLAGVLVLRAGNHKESDVNPVQMSTSEVVDNTEAQTETTSVPIYLPAEFPAYSTDAWKMNRLNYEFSALESVSSSTPVFESDILRNKIISVSFLDTLNNAPDTYWDISAAKDGAVLAWVAKNGNYYDLYIAGEGGVNGGTSIQGLFHSFTLLKEINHFEHFHTENVTDMSWMFYNCASLRHIDLSGLDTAKVESMESMFQGCWSLLDFDFTNIDTSSTIDMSAMFRGCTSLCSVKFGDSRTSRVENTNGMFENCRKLIDLDMWNFDGDSLKNIAYMFKGCGVLTSLDLSNFNTSKVTDMRYLFSSCSELRTLDVSSFDTSNVTNMDSMFGYCNNLKTLDLSNFDTRNVTSMIGTFWGCSDLQLTLDLGRFDTHKVQHKLYNNITSQDDNVTINGQPWKEIWG